jgi:leader peptidase (prepilin peptidase)/N-methyltransferase
MADLGLQLLAFGWGAIWGSFLNVVIYRLPIDLSVVKPGSHCPACEAPIRWYDNVPILSYFVLRGRCRRCETTFSPRYALVEATCAVLSLALFRASVLPLEPETLVHGLVMWAWLQVFVYGLIAITFIDLEHLYIPDVISLPLIALGVGGAFLIPTPAPMEHLFGALGAAGFLLLVVGFGWLVFRREAMGMGDVKLLSGLGAYLGWKALPFILFASATQALVAVAIARLYSKVTGRENELTRTTEELDAHFDEADRYADDLPGRLAVPYGPFLALAALEALFFGHHLIWDWADAIVLWLLPTPDL